MTLTKLEKLEASIKAYDELINRFQNDTNEKNKELVVKSLVNKASRLNDLNEFDKAIKTYDLVFENYKESSGEIFKQVAISMHNKSIILSKVGKESELFDLCDLIIENFSGINDPFISDMVSTAAVIKDKDRHQNSW